MLASYAVLLDLTPLAAGKYDEAVNTASGGELADGSDKQVYKDEGDGGGKDLTSESDDACLPTEIDQGTTKTRKTRDKGDLEVMDHTFASGQGKK